MKVKELIAQLLNCDQDKFVYVYDDANIFRTLAVDELRDRVDINIQRDE